MQMDIYLEKHSIIKVLKPKDKKLMLTSFMYGH